MSEYKKKVIAAAVGVLLAAGIGAAVDFDKDDIGARVLSATDMEVSYTETVSAADVTEGIDEAVPSITRMGGFDRYETSVLISQEGWEHAETVILAGGASYADALCGVPLAHALEAPVLLVSREGITDTVRSEMQRLQPRNVIILGGTTAVSDDVAISLINQGYSVRRIWGSDRYETSDAVSRAFLEISGGTENVFIASGENYPDALSASSAAAILGAPILYSPANGEIDENTLALINESGASSAFILGGTGAVGEAAEQRLASNAAASVERISGSDRYETSVRTYERFKDLFDSECMSFATGENFPDALAGSVLAAGKNMPVMLTGYKSQNDIVKDAVRDDIPERVYIFGSEDVVAQSDIDYYLTSPVEEQQDEQPVAEQPEAGSVTEMMKIEVANDGRIDATVSSERPGNDLSKINDMFAKETVTDAGAYDTPVIDDEQIMEALRNAQKRYGAVGIQAAVIENGEVRGTYSCGWAEKNVREMSSDTKIRTASLTKVAVALCAAKMQEQGIIDLDADISTYWGVQLPKPLTMRSLLTHTSTLQYLSYHPSKTATLAQLTGRDSYNNGEPGSRSVWAYNNYGYGVAGCTLELAAGMTLDEYADRWLLAPLAIKDAAFMPGDISAADDLAVLYYDGGATAMYLDDEKKLHAAPDAGDNVECYAGGFTSSAGDFAKIIAMLANDGVLNGVRIMDEQTVELMEHEHFETSEYGKSFGQCLALRRRKDLLGRKEIYYHTGNAFGMLALASYDPDTRDGVVVMTTGADGKRDANGLYAVCSEISEKVYAII